VQRASEAENPNATNARKQSTFSGYSSNIRLIFTDACHPTLGKQ
jgi:hypothetical protein